MNLLYITEDYTASKVHYNLLTSELEQRCDLTAYVVCPMRGKNRKSLVDSRQTHERLIAVCREIDVSPHRYKFNFAERVRCKIRMIEQNVPMAEIDVIHAATLYSDGAVAYKLSQKYGIPYLVVARTADLIKYTRKLFYLWPLANRIINRASDIVAVTIAIKDALVRNWRYLPSKSKLTSSLVIGNGIDDIWLNNLRLGHRNIGNAVKVLFIGRFDKNKNVLNLIEAVIKLRQHTDISLTLIGGNGEVHDDVLRLVNQHEGWLKYLGEIYDKPKLMQVVRQHDIFAMVSHHETLGLVYAECLSQGLPILYSYGTGFYGMYPEGFVGYGANSRSVPSIAKCLERIIDNFDQLSSNIASLDFGRFTWSAIAQEYLKLYDKHAHLA